MTTYRIPVTLDDRGVARPLFGAEITLQPGDVVEVYRADPGPRFEPALTFSVGAEPWCLRWLRRIARRLQP